jgi:hypothetical protein
MTIAHHMDIHSVIQVAGLPHNRMPRAYTFFDQALHHPLAATCRP